MANVNPADIVALNRRLADLDERLDEAWKAQELYLKAYSQAKRAYTEAEAQAILSGDCPRVERNGATVAERDAWVLIKTLNQWQELQLAEAQLKIAKAYTDHLSTLLSSLQTQSKNAQNMMFTSR